MSTVVKVNFKWVGHFEGSGCCENTSILLFRGYRKAFPKIAYNAVRKTITGPSKRNKRNIILLWYV